MIFHTNNQDLNFIYNYGRQNSADLRGTDARPMQILNTDNNQGMGLIGNSSTMPPDQFRLLVESFLSRNGNALNTHAFTKEELNILNRVMETSEVKLEEEFCPICFDVITHEGKKTMHPICHHRFHSDCLSSWLERKATCPVCRRGSRSGLLQELTDYLQKNQNGGDQLV